MTMFADAQSCLTPVEYPSPDSLKYVMEEDLESNSSPWGVIEWHKDNNYIKCNVYWHEFDGGGDPGWWYTIDEYNFPAKPTRKEVDFGSFEAWEKDLLLCQPKMAKLIHDTMYDELLLQYPMLKDYKKLVKSIQFVININKHGRVTYVRMHPRDNDKVIPPKVVFMLTDFFAHHQFPTPKEYGSRCTSVAVATSFSKIRRHSF